MKCALDVLPGNKWLLESFGKLEMLLNMAKFLTFTCNDSKQYEQKHQGLSFKCNLFSFFLFSVQKNADNFILSLVNAVTQHWRALRRIHEEGNALQPFHFYIQIFLSFLMLHTKQRRQVFHDKDGTK